MRKNYFMVVLLLFLAAAAKGQSVGVGTQAPSRKAKPSAPEQMPAVQMRYKGRLLEKGTQKPIKNANVFLLPSKLKATSDEKGFFEFAAVPAGEMEVVVNLPGYLKFERTDILNEQSQNLERKLFIEKESYSAFETTVIGIKQKRDDSSKTMKQEQFLTVPGAGGDPVKAIQNLPGVNRVQGFSSQVVIQGSAPQDTKYNIDGHEIPLVFHFGGLTSVITPEAVEQVDYFSAGYGPEYGRALGGIVSLKTRTADVQDRDKKGFYFFDTLKAGALYETKIDDQSDILISGRYSYVGFIVKRVVENNPTFNLTVVPEFADFSTVYRKTINSTDELKVTALFSKDTLGFLFKEPLREDPSIRGTFKNETTFYRFIPQWSRKLDSGSQLNLSAGAGQNWLLIDVGENYFRLSNSLVSLRGEYAVNHSPTWKYQVGFDNFYNRANVDVKLPVLRNDGGINNPVSSSEVRQVSVAVKNNDTALYWRNEINPIESQFTYLPSVRLDRVGLTKEVVLSPRFGARYKVDDYFLLKAAGGTYVQAPQPQETSSVFGNPDVRAPRAIHSMVGAERDFRGGSSRGYILSTSLFDRWFQNLVIQSSKFIERDGSVVPEIFNNSGQGRAYGLEILLKTEFEPYSGWVSYTYSKSQRWDPLKPVYDFQYDQTHNWNFVSSYDLKNNWKISGRYRYVTGNPYTPVEAASFDADNDVFIPQRGPLYSKRLSDFQQLDLRIDKKWIRNEQITTAYLDIQNVLGNRNPESLQYAYDYSSNQAVEGLPFLIALGLKMEY